MHSLAFTGSIGNSLEEEHENHLMLPSTSLVGIFLITQQIK